jgi:hypothetical protein
LLTEGLGIFTSDARSRPSRRRVFDTVRSAALALGSGTRHHDGMMADADVLLADFAEAAARAEIEGWPCGLRSQVLSAPHRATSLPPGSTAVYVFAFSTSAGRSAPCGPGTVLKVGKVGPNSEARFRYMHYNPGSSNSNLAKSLLTHQILWPFLGIQRLTSGDVGERIRASMDRTNFFVPAGHPQVLATLEVYARARVGSVFEGA